MVRDGWTEKGPRACSGAFLLRSDVGVVRRVLRVGVGWNASGRSDGRRCPGWAETWSVDWRSVPVEDNWFLGRECGEECRSRLVVGAIVRPVFLLDVFFHHVGQLSGLDPQ
jgi:hypothetical protein